MPTLTREYDTFDAYLDRVLSSPIKWEVGHCASIKGEEGFTGTRSWEHACALIRDGWPEGRSAMVREMDAAALVTPSIPHVTRFFDVAGAYPVAAMAAAGEPASMVNLGDVSAAARPVVRLAFSFSYSAIKTTDQVRAYGAALLSWIDHIEDSGRSVELMGCHRAGAGKSSFRNTVIFKRAGEPLEIDRMAFVISHASFLRRIHFRAYEIEGAAGFERDLCWGYGAPNTSRPNDLDADQHWLPGPNDFQGSTVAEAVPFLEAHIRAALDPTPEDDEDTPDPEAEGLD